MNNLLEFYPKSLFFSDFISFWEEGERGGLSVDRISENIIDLQLSCKGFCKNSQHHDMKYT